VVDRENHP